MPTICLALAFLGCARKKRKNQGLLLAPESRREDPAARTHSTKEKVMDEKRKGLRNVK